MLPKSKQYITSIIFILTLIGASLAPFFVYAQVGGTVSDINTLKQQIAAKKAKIDELQKSIDEYKKKANQKHVESQSLKNQLSILDNQIARTNLNIESTQTQLDELNLEIESLGLSISDKQKIIDRQKSMIAEFIRHIHTEDQKNYVQIMAAYDTFSDFYNRVQYLQKIDRDLGKTIRTIKDAQQSLQEQKQQTEEKKHRYEILSQTLLDQKESLQEQTTAKQTLLDKTRGQEATYNTLVSNLKKQYQDIESDISSIEMQVRKQLDAQNKLTAINDASGFFAWPTQSRYLTATFHDPDYPYRNVFEHNAIDIRASQGTPVHAAGSGYIARAKRCSSSSCYAYVMIIHANGLSTVYGHLNMISVNEEQFVSRGDVIGYSGGTPGTVGAGPFVTGPHLHFEVRVNGIPVDPLGYLPRDN